MRILIAEDEEALGRYLERGLRGEGREIEVAPDGNEALRHFLEREPDLLLLDLELPGRSGMDVLRQARAISPLCPVLVLSGRADTSTRTECLEAGADDCLQKPFSLGELRARCNALLRRSRAFQDTIEGLLGAAQTAALSARAAIVRCGTLELDRMRRAVEVGGMPVRLTNREFALLEQLLLSAGAPVSRAALYRLVWEGKQVEGNVVDVHIAALRRKLGPLAPAIQTVRGAGFQIMASAPDQIPDQISAVLPAAVPLLAQRSALGAWVCGARQ